MALYKTNNPYQYATSAMSGASGTAANMSQEKKTTVKEADKTLGGGLVSGAMGAMAGAQLQNYMYPAASEAAKMGGGAAQMFADAKAFNDGLQMAKLAGGMGEYAAMFGEVSAEAGAATAAAATGEGAASGASIGPWGAIAGAAIGLLSYYL
jgi:hypothetical protein